MKQPRPLGVLNLAWRSILHHRLTTVVTVLSVAMATGLVMAVFALQDQSRRAVEESDGGFDAVLGARGSALQLVLNSIYHLESSQGNLPWSVYQAIASDPRISEAVPLALGDNYFGYRLVGTSTDHLDGRNRDGQPRFNFAEGRRFEKDTSEAVLGSIVADKLGLAVGDTIQPYHGLVFDPGAQHQERYPVCGVLEPTGTPGDRVIWVSLDAVFRMEGHVLRGSGEVYEPSEGQTIPDDHKEVSAVLLRLRSPQAGFMLNQTINRQGNVATFAWPISTIVVDFLDKVSWMGRLLEVVAAMVMVVAAATIFAGIASSLGQRRRAFAILRALGSRRRRIVAVILTEASLLAAAGAVLGYAVYLGLALVAAQALRHQVGVIISLGDSLMALVVAPLVMVMLGVLAAIVPALRAYSTDVVGELADRT
jgi:putative ABC transport system permease protein